ncbi:hypothetical protein G6045_03380 [Streptomyces sp. YC504]|uniref:LPXTG cell wall anchor domain-containing protein n=1 Tax=Streptomyces mesophilus TaxID=1775132 RepID=A0A6G4XC45_9ACTN|nr:hypothetical protein [Streptomyces mesophilus]NGO74732.1 hypothetical protein [Streptomyces mesophilus]
MYARTLAVGTLLAGAALGLAGPTAQAVEAGAVAVTPSSAGPGQSVRIGASGCASANPNASARAYSDAFPTASLTAVGGAGEVSGTSNVFSGAKAGTYTVTVVCDVSNPSQKYTGSFTVTGSSTTPQGVRGGLGGSFEDAGPGTIAAGAALVAVGLGATAYTVRRRMQRSS